MNEQGAESQVSIPVPMNLDATPISRKETLATAAQYNERGLGSLLFIYLFIYLL